MRAASGASSKQEAIRLRRKCQQLITEAERLKAALAASQSPSQSLLQKTSRLHGNDFPPWTIEPPEKDFALKPGQALFMYEVFDFSETDLGPEPPTNSILVTMWHSHYRRSRRRLSTAGRGHMSCSTRQPKMDNPPSWNLAGSATSYKT